MFALWLVVTHSVAFAAGVWLVSGHKRARREAIEARRESTRFRSVFGRSQLPVAVGRHRAATLVDASLSEALAALTEARVKRIQQHREFVEVMERHSRTSSARRWASAAAT